MGNYVCLDLQRPARPELAESGSLKRRVRVFHGNKVRKVVID